VRVVQEFESVYLLIKLHTFEVVKLWLVRLHLSKVSVVEVAGVFQVRITENDDPTALVSNGQEVARLVEAHCGQDVGIRHVIGVSLAQAIHIDPVKRLIGGCSCLLLLRAANLTFWFAHWDLWNAWISWLCMRRGC
jgi:hypothetical protein